jgi:hypothetical protein
VELDEVNLAKSYAMPWLHLSLLIFGTEEQVVCYFFEAQGFHHHFMVDSI